MNSLRFWLATTAVFLMALPDIGQACSPAEVSLYEQVTKHSKVFLGTVKEKIKEPSPGRGVYTIFVDEAFKGLPDKDKWGGKIEVALSESEQCGLGIPKKNGKILVFMNDGDIVNQTSHSWLIWREAEQHEAWLNPVMDDLVTLRRMLFPKNQEGIAPDEDTALHQALKVLIPVLAGWKSASKCRSRLLTLRIGPIVMTLSGELKARLIVRIKRRNTVAMEAMVPM